MVAKTPKTPIFHISSIIEIQIYQKRNLSLQTCRTRRGDQDGYLNRRNPSPESPKFEEKLPEHQTFLPSILPRPLTILEGDTTDDLASSRRSYWHRFRPPSWPESENPIGTVQASLICFSLFRCLLDEIGTPLCSP